MSVLPHNERFLCPLARRAPWPDDRGLHGHAKPG